MTRRSADFEPAASASSAIPAGCFSTYTGEMSSLIDVVEVCNHPAAPD